ncbi:MAG: hypothetical protein Q9208_001890 [Pyrenodesmia sp. 3 TL-2023]
MFILPTSNSMLGFSFAELACILSFFASFSLQISNATEDSVLQDTNLEEPSNMTANPVDGLSCSNAPQDDASSDDFHSNAYTIIDQCVRRLRKGGILKDFTVDKHLKLVVKRYEPTVDCEPRTPAVPSYDNCEDALEWMPTTTKPFGFTTVEQTHHDPHRV